MLLAKSRPIVVISMTGGSHFARECLMAFTPWHLDAVSGSHPPHLLCSALRTHVGHRAMSDKGQEQIFRDVRGTSASGRLCCKSRFASLITKFLSHRRVFHVRMWGSHDLALTSPVTSVIRLESPLLAVLACLGFSQKNHRSSFSDFCNTIGPEPTCRDVRHESVIRG